MAKVKITGHASGTGILTVTAPNTSSDRTITLPDATGTLLNSDGSGASLTALNGTQVTSGTVPAARLPAGSVLQVVTATYATETTTTSNTFVSTGFSASITPSATSSKILCLVHLAGLLTYTNTEVEMATLFRDSTNLGTGAGATASTYDAFVTHWDNTSDQTATSASFSVLDSPSTTSAITYTPKFGSTGGNTVYVHVWEQTSTITLLEIAG